jgi:hypothetical protein
VELLTHSHSAKDQKHIYLPSSTLDLGSQFPSSSTTLDLQSHNQNTKRNQHCDLGQFHSSTTASDQRKKSPRRMGETGASTVASSSSSSSMERCSGCWVRDWWSYDRRRQTDRKTGLRVYRNTILDLEKRRRKMGIRRRRGKKGTREEGSEQEAADKKKDSELV